MSSVQDMIDEINDHGFTDTSVTRKVALINDTVWDICAREPWPFLEKKATLSFDGTNPSPTNFPTDFRAVMSIIRTDNGDPLDPERYDVMKRKYGQTLLSAGQPVAYYFLGETLNIYYVPSSSMTLDMEYLSNHPALTQSSLETAFLIPPQHHRAILLGTLYKLYDMDDDYDIGASFQAQYEDRILKMRTQLWTRQYDRPDRIYGIDDFDLQFLS
ncbi:MAG: hypothetical protein KGL39_15125 [Patescibacteria group bacterium]|nr:hypothetical protein [Patescibacteria group bacterium]